MKIINAFANWVKKLFLEFTNIYDDHEMRDNPNSFIGESSSFGADYLTKLRGTDPITGEKRKISVKKILFRILIVILVIFFVFIFLRINTDISFWGRGYY